MKSEIKYVVPNDTPVPVGTTIGSSAIAEWFAADIQYSVRTLEEMIGTINDIVSGNRASGYQGTGNAFSVMVQDSLVFLECEHYEEHKVIMTVEQAISALKKYKSFLDSRDNFSQETPPPFEVEYEAEGQAALDRYLETGGSLGQE